MDNARQKCHEVGAALPMPRSDQEQTDLVATKEHFGLDGLGISSTGPISETFQILCILADSVYRGLALDAYEETSGVYVDSVGNPLTYFAWGSSGGYAEPTSPMTERFVALWPSHNFKWADIRQWHTENVLCVKCHPGYYRGPQTFLYIDLYT